MQTLSQDRPIPPLAISFAPAWWVAHYGRLPDGQTKARLLYERFGDLGLGQADPAPPEPCVGGDYGDRFMSAFWGCEIAYRDGQFPAAIPLPDPRQRMEGLRLPDLDTSPVAQRAFADAAALRAEHGRCSAAVNYGGPLNNAVSVFGQEILAVCAEAPDLARRVLQLMAQGVLLVHDGIVCRINQVAPADTRAGGWGIGNCPVCTISPAVYRDVVRPSDLWLAGQFAGGFGLHHCGVFDAYAEVYKPLRPVALDLGPGSDLRIARAAYPEAAISTYLEVGAVSRMTRSELDAAVARLVAEAGDTGSFTAISVAEAGPEVSDATVRDLMTVKDRLA
jgi:hypothetical protein